MKCFSSSGCVLACGPHVWHPWSNLSFCYVAVYTCIVIMSLSCNQCLSNTYPIYNKVHTWQSLYLNVGFIIIRGRRFIAEDQTRCCKRTRMLYFLLGVKQILGLASCYSSEPPQLTSMLCCCCCASLTGTGQKRRSCSSVTYQHQTLLILSGQSLSSPWWQRSSCLPEEVTKGLLHVWTPQLGWALNITLSFTQALGVFDSHVWS